MKTSGTRNPKKLEARKPEAKPKGLARLHPDDRESLSRELGGLLLKVAREEAGSTVKLMQHQADALDRIAATLETKRGRVVEDAPATCPRGDRLGPADDCPGCPAPSTTGAPRPFGIGAKVVVREEVDLPYAGREGVVGAIHARFGGDLLWVDWESWTDEEVRAGAWVRRGELELRPLAPKDEPPTEGSPTEGDLPAPSAKKIREEVEARMAARSGEG